MTKKEALDILGLEENPTIEEIKKAHRKLTKLHHPDKYDQAPESVRLYHEEELKKINASYDYFTKFNLSNYRLETINRINSYLENNNVEALDLLILIQLLANQYSDLVYLKDNQVGIDALFADFIAELKENMILIKLHFIRIIILMRQKLKKL